MLLLEQLISLEDTTQPFNGSQRMSGMTLNQTGLVLRHTLER